MGLDRIWRRRAVVVLVMLWCGLVVGHAGAQTAEPLKREGVWAHAYVDRPADPSVLFGQLPNGLRYAIRKNATPVGHTALRLRIGAGSLDERDDQQGLAHFLEHMAFRGSAHVPAGDMVKILQRLGLAFGPDTNAHTGFDETVYQLDLPQSDRETVDTGLMLLREIAGELTLAQTEMDPERGVVLSEERVRDGPAYRKSVAQLGFQLEGQLAAHRLPIGKTEILREAPVSLIREFYEAHYRPDNALVVAVGDFDVAAMEAAIRGRFGDWAAKPVARPTWAPGTVRARGATVRLLTAAGTPPGLSITWVQPYDGTADTRVRERRDLADAMAMSVLNTRLSRQAQAEGAPFLSASAGRANMMKSARVAVLNVQPRAGAWEPALAAAIAAQRQLVEFGVQPDEIARAATETRNELRTAADGAATRASSEIANIIVQAAGDDEVVSSPEQDRDEVEAMLVTMGREEIDAAARRIFAGSGPLVFLAGAAEVPGGEEAVRAALARELSAPALAPSAEAVRMWPYAPAAVPGVVAERTSVADLGVTELRFANGVGLIVKRTAFARDEVRVRVRVGQGRLGIAPERAAATWLASGVLPVLRLGGTRELTYEDIQTLTAANRIGLRQSIDDDAFVFDGTTRPADLDRQMQLLQATIVAPGLRAAAFERIKSTLQNQLPQLEASASGVLGRVAGQLLRGGDLRWQVFPDAAGVAGARLEDLAALIGADFAVGPIEVTVVGDIEEERAIEAVARSFGAIGPRPRRAAPGAAADTVRFPGPGAAPVALTHAGRRDQAAAMIAWPTADFFADPQQQRALGVMAAVMETRLIERLRTAEGVTYSPNVGTSTSDVFRGMGTVQATVETPVDKVEVFFSEVERIVAAMRDASPSEDELERAKRPRVDRRIKLLQDNGYWVASLASAHGDGRHLDAIRALVTGTERVSAADVQAVARRFLDPATALRVVVRPAER